MERQSQERSLEESGSRKSSTVTTPTPTERRTSYQTTVDAESASDSTAKSFLQDHTPVRGMQDIIGRMRAGDAGKYKHNTKTDACGNRFLERGGCRVNNRAAIVTRTYRDIFSS